MYFHWMRFVVLGLAVSSAAVVAQEPKAIKALLVTGGCCHDYRLQTQLLAEGLSKRAHVHVTAAYDPDTTTKHINPVYERADWADGFDVVIHDECSADVKDIQVIERILAPHKKGLPAVMLHCAMHSYRSEGYPQATPWFEFTGLQTTAHGPRKPIDISFIAGSSPVVETLKDWRTIDEELYNNITGKLLETASPLASGKQVVPNRDGGEQTNDAIVVWTNLYQKQTRVFATTLGHTNETVADARYLDLVTRGLLWSCDKLNGEYLKVQ